MAIYIRAGDAGHRRRPQGGMWSETLTTRRLALVPYGTGLNALTLIGDRSG